MRFVQKVLFGIRSAKEFRSASRLAFLRKDQEALDALSTYKGPAEYVAKAELMSADILYRMRRYREATERYSSFLSLHISNIGNKHSQEYLKFYAVFFQENALRNAGESVPHTVTLERLKGLAGKAPFLDQKEFPLP